MTGPEIGQRIQLLRDDMSQTAFANLLEISRSSLLRYEKGERLPDGAVLGQICVKLGANGHWLLTGEGEAYTSEDMKHGVTRSQKGSSPNGLLEVWESAADREFSLATHRAAAEAASHRSALRVLTALEGVYPNGSELSELKDTMVGDEFSPRTVEAALLLLLRAGLVKETQTHGAMTYRVAEGMGSLHFRDDPETSAAVITVIEALLNSIMPAVARQSGKVITSEVRVPKGRSRSLAKSILAQIKSEVSQATELDGGEESLTLIFGVAVDDGEVLDS